MTAALAAAGRWWPVQQYPLGLSHREALVVRGLVAGLQAKQIAVRMQTSKIAVDRVVRGAKDKTGCPTLSALAVAWVRATEVRQAYERGKAEGGGRMAA